MFDVKARTILKVKHGSHAYGLNTPESDVDYKGICIEPFDYMISVVNNFEQQEHHVSKGYDSDETIFGLFKFTQLALPSNPNVLEIMFVEPEEIEYKNEYGSKLLSIRDKFLSKKAYWTFGSYSKSQLKRVERHRKWILNPPELVPTRTEYGLPEKAEIPKEQQLAAFSAIQKKLDFWNFKDMSEQDKALRLEFSNVMAELLAEMSLTSDEQWRAAGRSLGIETNFLEVLEKEKKYKNLQDEYKNYLEWQKNRNKKRYELEIKCNADPKHCSHLLRLYFEVIDILKGNGLILKRPKEERQLLLDVKQGKFGKETYAEVIKLQQELEIKLNDALLNSKIPEKPDYNFIDNFMREMYVEYWKNEDKVL